MRQRLSTLGKAAGLGVAAVATLALTGCNHGNGAAGASQSQPPGQSQTSQAPSGSAAPSSPSSSSGSSSGSTPADKTELTIAVRESKTAKASTYTLRCDPTSGNLPKKQQACTALDAAAASGSDPFQPTPKHQMCTDIYGGPQTATVTGTWNGKKVRADFNRKNGCETTRWSKLAPLFG